MSAISPTDPTVSLPLTNKVARSAHSKFTTELRKQDETMKEMSLSKPSPESSEPKEKARRRFEKGTILDIFA